MAATIPPVAEGVQWRFGTTPFAAGIALRERGPSGAFAAFGSDRAVDHVENFADRHAYDVLVADDGSIPGRAAEGTHAPGGRGMMATMDDLPLPGAAFPAELHR